MITVMPREVHSILRSTPGSIFVDVRSPGEFSALHASDARNVPLEQLANAPLLAEASRDRKIVLICQSGSRSRKASELLESLGFTNVTEVSGGTTAWNDDGLPVVRGSGVISLERQVRIGAGVLVLLGVLIGDFLHPVGYLLAAFVGVGLAFAGITDTCGMAILLAKMPWNTRGSECCSTTRSCQS
jgi:rhodanese-related sulfurtransferase